MIQLPDRISSLIRQIEQGQPVTHADARRLSLLQSLDLVQAGEQFARDAIARDEAYAEALKDG